MNSSQNALIPKNEDGWIWEPPGWYWIPGTFPDEIKFIKLCQNIKKWNEWFASTYGPSFWTPSLWFFHTQHLYRFMHMIMRIILLGFLSQIGFLGQVGKYILHYIVHIVYPWVDSESNFDILFSLRVRIFRLPLYCHHFRLDLFPNFFKAIYCWF